MSGESRSQGESYSDSESVADVPIFIPVPFQELSTINYYSLDEQLTELIAALKEQYGRHCFIKIQHHETQPMLVPFVKNRFTSKESKGRYFDRQYARAGALTGGEVDDLLESQERALLKVTTPEIDETQTEQAPAQTETEKRIKKITKPIYANIPDDNPFA